MYLLCEFEVFGSKIVLCIIFNNMWTNQMPQIHEACVKLIVHMTSYKISVELKEVYKFWIFFLQIPYLKQHSTICMEPSDIFTVLMGSCTNRKRDKWVLLIKSSWMSVNFGAEKMFGNRVGNLQIIGKYLSSFYRI